MLKYHICEYGCDNSAKFKLKNGKYCCSLSYQSCPNQRILNSNNRQIIKFYPKRVKRIKENIHNLSEINGSKFDINNSIKTRDIKVICIDCRKERTIKLSDYLQSKTFFCKRCVSIGDRNISKKPEIKKKIKESAKNKDLSYLTPEWRKKFSNNRKGKGNPRYGKKHSLEQRRRIKESHKRKFLDPKYCEEFGRRFQLNPNNLEKQVLKILNRLYCDEYKFVGDHSFWIEGKNPDFVNTNGKKKIIEAFGIYWHGKTRTGQNEEDHEKERIDHFLKYGFKTLIIWEDELRNVKKLEEKIIRFHNKEKI